MEMPGIGLVHAATISAIIETPHRFANKKKLWMYAGVGLMERSSGEKVYSRKLTREYNRPQRGIRDGQDPLDQGTGRGTGR